MKYKAIISDFDGTLVSHNSQLSSQIINLIRQYKDRGGQFSLATGRDFAGHIIKACRDLQLSTPQITSGGAEIVNPVTGQVIIGHYINQHIVKAIIERLLSQDVTIIVSQGGLLYTQKPEFSGPYKDITRQLSDLRIVNIPKIRITINPDQREVIRHMLSSLQGEFAEQIVIHQSDTVRSIGFDITSPQATKQLAVLEVSKIMGIEPHHIAGIGDGYNDFPLLSACGYKVAMDHAPQELKDIADYIAPPHENGGPQAAIKHIMTL